ncbi:MAG TPA: saccharopine dehydrogenase NADP-binding domain-containing protein [bacterium]
MEKWIIYGAYGYTGELIAEEALRRGHRPILAGRSEKKLAPLAERLNLEKLVIDLADPSGIRKSLSGAGLIFNAAGPFVYTNEPIIQACLDAGTNYLDITGEIPALTKVFSYDEPAKRKGICLIPGAGFDVIPSDCLAKYLSDRLPGASELELAFAGLDSPSAGTAKTMVEMIPKGGFVRRNGKIVPHPFGSGVRKIKFPHGERAVLPIPWGDLETGYRSTGILNITTCMAYPAFLAYTMRLTGPIIQKLLAIKPIQRFSQNMIEKLIRGPGPESRKTRKSYLWGRVSDGKGKNVEAWLEILETYEFTAVAGVRTVEKVFELNPTGALTPSQAFGKDFVLEIEGTKRYDRLPI